MAKRFLSRSETAPARWRLNKEYALEYNVINVRELNLYYVIIKYHSK